MKFSERFGFKRPQDLQVKMVSMELRNDIINMYINICRNLEENDWDYALKFNQNIWEGFFHNLSYQVKITDVVQLLLKLEWYELFDFWEYIIKNSREPRLYSACNRILENHNSAYRFINENIVSISNEVDAKNVENSIMLEFDNGHIKKATAKLSDKHPDYPQIIGESIDGLEIAVQNVINDSLNKKATDKFGENIKILKSAKFLDDHPAYIEALNKLYGYSSDGGIRHPKSRNYKITEADAVFAVEMCSAFISLLKFKASTLQH